MLQGGVEAAALIIFRRRREFIFEAEGVEEGAQPRIIMRAETRMRAERVRHLRQGLAEIGGDEFLIRDVVGDLAQPVQVVGEGEEARRDPALGHDFERAAHHAGARDLAEGADMRQAGRAVAGLEQHALLTAGFHAFDELSRLFERPGGRDARGFDEFGRQ